MTNNILLFTGFVGGRGGSKKAAWAYAELTARGYCPIVASECSYSYKIDDLEMKPDILVRKGKSDEETYENCQKALRDVPFSFMLSFGPRTFGPRVAYRRKIPYSIIDGGLPPYLAPFPSDHDKDVLLGCKNFLLTCNFPWKFPKNAGLPQARVTTQPYQATRVKKFRNLRNLGLNALQEKLRPEFPELADYDRLVYLNMTDEYVNEEIVEPNGWLKRREFEECRSFSRLLVEGLGKKLAGEKVLLFLEGRVALGVADLLPKYPNIRAFGRDFIDPDTDILLKKLADLNICRAARCDKQSELALIGKASITTPCPTSYMDEDTAALQAQEMGITKLIAWDDPQYAQKAVAFMNDGLEQERIEKNLAQAFDLMWKNDNPWDLIIHDIPS